MVAPTHRTRSNTGSFSGGRTPAITIPGLSTPAATPAILPEVSSPLASSAPAAAGWLAMQMANQRASLAAIPQSPIGNSPKAVPSSQYLQSPGASEAGGNKDYFSMKKNKDTSPNRDGGDRVPQTPGPTTPGGSFMGKFKGFGKKKGVAETPMSTVVETTQEVVEPEVSVPVPLTGDFPYIRQD